MNESYSKIKSNELIRGIIYEKDEFTQEEIQGYRKELIDHIHMLVDYFAYHEYNNGKSIRERLELLAFTILSTIDGESGSCGGYLLIPIPESHFYDPNFTIPDDLWNYDIAGALHDQYVRSYLK